MSPEKTDKLLIEAIERIADSLDSIDDTLENIAYDVNLIRRGEKYSDD